MGDLICRRRGIAVLGAQCPNQPRKVQQIAEFMRVGIAQINPDRVFAICLLHGAQAGCGHVQRFLPRHLFECAIHLEQWRGHTVGIGAKILQRDGLGADMPPRQGIVRVGFDADHPILGVGDDQAAHGLANIAGAIVFLFGHDLPSPLVALWCDTCVAIGIIQGNGKAAAAQG